MIENFTIEGYRGFERFEMTGFGRINLLVGRNNAGKTSVLEGIRLLRTSVVNAEEVPGVLWETAERRGETVADHVRLRHLLHHPGNATAKRTSKVTLSDGLSHCELRIVNDHGHKLRMSCTSQRDGEGKLERPRWHLVDRDALPRPRDLALREQEGWACPPINGPEPLSASAQADRFGRIVLGPAEDQFIESMRIIDPRIQRCGATSGEKPQLVVKLEGVGERLPLGQLGGGVARFAQLWLSLALANQGPLLIDEIDIGLHHTVMMEMWRRLRHLAIAQDIQVFATTHSWDCVSALGMMSHADKVPADEVTLHRIEPAKGHSVRYSAERILLAAEQGIEVR